MSIARVASEAMPREAPLGPGPQLPRGVPVRNHAVRSREADRLSTNRAKSSSTVMLGESIPLALPTAEPLRAGMTACIPTLKASAVEKVAFGATDARQRTKDGCTTPRPR